MRLSLRNLAIATTALLDARLRADLLHAPNDADQGFVQKIFYLHVPLGDLRPRRLRRRRDPRHQAPAHGQGDPRRAGLRLDPHLDHLRRRRADHRGDLGARVLGQVVGLGRADACQLPDRLPPLLHLLPAAIRDRGPRSPGPLRLGLRDHGRRLRAAQLHRGADGRVAGAPARVRHRRGRDARRDVAGVPRSHGGDGDAVGDPGALRADRQVGLGANLAACAARSTPRPRSHRGSRIAPAVPASRGLVVR